MLAITEYTQRRNCDIGIVQRFSELENFKSKGGISHLVSWKGLADDAWQVIIAAPVWNQVFVKPKRTIDQTHLPVHTTGRKHKHIVGLLAFYQDVPNMCKEFLVDTENYII